MSFCDFYLVFIFIIFKVILFIFKFFSWPQPSDEGINPGTKYETMRKKTSCSEQRPSRPQRSRRQPRHASKNSPGVSSNIEHLPRLKRKMTRFLTSPLRTIVDHLVYRCALTLPGESREIHLVIEVRLIEDGISNETIVEAALRTRTWSVRVLALSPRNTFSEGHHPSTPGGRRRTCIKIFRKEFSLKNLPPLLSSPPLPPLPCN